MNSQKNGTLRIVYRHTQTEMAEPQLYTRYEPHLILFIWGKLVEIGSVGVFWIRSLSDGKNIPISSEFLRPRLNF